MRRIYTLFLRMQIKMQQLVDRLLHSESGMTLPLLAFSLTMLVGLAGIAIDTARVQMVQAKLQTSLDSAGLAASSTVSTANMGAEAQKYLNTNFNGYLGATLGANSPSITANNTNTVFTLAATATVPTTFMGALGINNVILNVSSQVSRAVTGLELVFVLDNTGSMSDTAGGNQSKIQALQTATTTLIRTLFGGAATSTNGKLWVGIVPFSQAVNIGTSHPTWLGNVNASINNNWNGCVDARQAGYDVTDTPPSQNNTDSLFNLRSYTQCKTSRRTGVTTCTVVASCTPATRTTCVPTGPYHYATPLDDGVTYDQNPSCAQKVTPMTSDSTSLLNAVSAMTANGNTVINEGLGWGWRMLSPSWQGLWGGTMSANGLPLAYNTRGMAKAIVLVTDGENTIDNSLQGAYWYAQNGWTGSTSTSGAQTALDNKTLALCNAIKQQGIYIYTIGLGTSGGINTSLLRSCATAVNYYFLSPSTTQLQSVFDQIGDSLSNLRISQ